MYIETDKSFHITIQPTNKCNLKCSYCYQTGKGNTDLLFEDVKLFLDKLFAHDNEYFNGFLRDDYFNIILDFIGGEATLNMPLINQTVSYFIHKCVEAGNLIWLHSLSIWLQTNGTTYFRDDVQRFIKQYHAKLDLPITIDGSKECHDACRVYHDGKGSYDDVVKAVKHYMATYKRQPNSKLTVSPSNVSSMFSAIKNMIDLGYSACRISCTNNETWSDEAAEIFERQLEMYYDYIEKNGIEFNLYPYSDVKAFNQGIRCATCGADGNSICLACDGKLFLCQAFSDICTDSQGRKPLSIGDVKTGISDEGARILRLIPERNRQIVDADEKCLKCPSNSICEYCPAMDYFRNGFESKPQIFKGNCRLHSVAYKLLQEHLKSQSDKKLS